MKRYILTFAAIATSLTATLAQSNFTEKAAGVDIPMVFVGETTFNMGGSEEQGSDTEDDEKLHQVTISSFYIGATEITQSQWEKVMGTSLRDMYDRARPSHDFGKYGVGENRPMYYVSWQDAVDFCRRLSSLTGRNYRLPTESEWELAARAGKSGGTKYAGSDNIDEVGWYVDNADMDRFNKGNPESHPVATRLPNPLDIYDMSGNVNEWVQDYYAPYSNEPATDPVGARYNDDRVYRGGAFLSSKNYCRVSFRNSNSPDLASESIGFRVVCEP